MGKRLFEAAACGCIETIRTLFALGANVHAIDSNGNTLLHVVIRQLNQEAIKLEDCEELVKFLIEIGIDINCKNEDGETALELAWSYNDQKKINTNIVKMLIKAGAVINFSRRYEDTNALLHVAAWTGDTELVRLLIDHGADISQKGYLNLNALHYASSKITNEDPALFETLIAAGIDVNEGNEAGVRPIHVMTLNRPSCSLNKIMKVFVKNNVDFNATSSIRPNLTCLDFAIEHSNTEAVKMFLRYGKFDVNEKFKSLTSNPNGETILHGACSKFDLPTVKYLLKFGADVNALNNENRTPLKLVIDLIVDNNYQSHSIFNRHSYSYRERRREAYRNRMKLVRCLLKCNADVNTITAKGENILTPRSLFGNDLPKYLWETLLKYIAKLQAMGTPIHSGIHDTISKNPEYERYFSSCVDEIDKLKSNKINPKYWITFFKLLIDNKKKICRYMGNEMLLKEFKKRKIVRKYPIYGKEIYKKFEKAVERRKIWDQARRTLSEILPINVDSEHFITEKILGYLKTEDLLILKDLLEN